MATDASAAGPSTAGSVLFASAIGAIAGAALTGHRGRRALAVGTAVGATGLAASEAVARARQRPGEIPALWQRIAVSAAMAAPARLAGGSRRARWPARRRDRHRRGRRGCSACARRRWRSGPVVGALVGSAYAARDERAPASGRGEHHRARVPDVVGAGVPRRAGQPARRAGRGERRCRSSSRCRRAPATSAPATCVTWPPCWAASTGPTRRTPASSPRSTTLAGPRVRPGDRRPAGARVLRAHDPVQPRHRPGLAALGAAGLPALPDAGRPSAGAGERAR